MIQLPQGTRLAEAPDHRIIREVQRRLRAQQGELGPRQPVPILDQVVGTVLSQHTSDAHSGRAFARLKARFPAWKQAAHAPAWVPPRSTTRPRSRCRQGCSPG